MTAPATAPQFQPLDEQPEPDRVPELFDPIDRFPSIPLDPPPRDPTLTADMMGFAGCALSIAGTGILGGSLACAGVFRVPLDAVAPGIIAAFCFGFAGLASFFLAYIAEVDIG